MTFLKYELITIGLDWYTYVRDTWALSLTMTYQIVRSSGWTVFGICFMCSITWFVYVMSKTNSINVIALIIIDKHIDFIWKIEQWHLSHCESKRKKKRASDEMYGKHCVHTASHEANINYLFYSPQNTQQAIAITAENILI